MLPNVYFDRLEKKRKMEQKEKNEEANEERKEAVCKPISFHPSVGRTLPSAAPQAPHLHTGAQREKNEPGGTRAYALSIRRGPSEFPVGARTHMYHFSAD